jgi:hypothetical protein
VEEIDVEEAEGQVRTKLQERLALTTA